MKLNVLWIEDVERNQKAIWYNLSLDLESRGYEWTVNWQDSGRIAAQTVHERNRNRGRVGFTDESECIHLMLVDFNLEDTIQSGQTTALNGQQVIRECRVHDPQLPILFYTSNQEVELAALVQGEDLVYCTTRDMISAEVLRLLSRHFPLNIP